MDFVSHEILPDLYVQLDCFLFRPAFTLTFNWRMNFSGPPLRLHTKRDLGENNVPLIILFTNFGAQKVSSGLFSQLM
jgi:hypothetical protein